MNERNRLLFTGRARRFPLMKIALGFLLLFIFCAWAYAAPQTDTSPFTETLKAPPAFVPEYMAEKDNAAAMYSDGIYAVYAADKASIREGQPVSVTASQISDSNWSLAVEAVNSPVKEEHGNEERHESLGGMVKGTLHF
ncbi:hypothetical protein NB640_10215 [Oxalobacter vibrioformis]|uniref:Uncharacterized protein n=1 Tax=Oxalobacter vibrioformis TaxID=933080 RepID=A0A9E9P270_9BURK|nr:hypothetical protein [Oxalobacter vibrioformis]NLC24748.1 hypothetical protein [Oxalobacter sp.]WAW09597.1 hypothetical protein NB640_10215 [Oxalobacter vibrioformis]